MFQKDDFTDKLEKLTQHLKTAESLLMKKNDKETETKLNNSIENASKLLTSLFGILLANKTAWEPDVWTKRKGNYDNAVTRFKSIQQNIEVFPQRRFTP